MNFLSFGFAIFILIVLALFAAFREKRQFILLGASLFFYLTWDWRFAVLHIFCSAVAFVSAQQIHLPSRKQQKRAFLWSTALVYLFILCTFKYLHYFSESAAALFGLDPSHILIRVGWPIGLSYYSFQSLGYVIDVYRGRSEPEKNFSQFLLFTSFFPQILIGPIERFHRLMPQLRELSSAKSAWREGFYLFLFGLFKKLVIAERLVPIVQFENDPLSELKGTALIVYSLICYFQMYCDFSGYTDMARGTAKFFGINLIDNFYQPYLAKNPGEVWNRWHHSLVSWLRDYVYWPLLLLTRNPYFTVSVLMLGIGLWHAPTWQCVLWAVYWSLIYFFYLALPNLFKSPWTQKFKSLAALQVLIMLLLAALSSIIIIGPSSSPQILQTFQSLLQHSTSPLGAMVAFTDELLIACFGLGLMIALETWQHQRQQLRFLNQINPSTFYTVAALLLIFAVVSFGKIQDTAFIYMRF